MAEFMLKHSKAPLKQPKAIQFGVFSPEQMTSMSVLTADVMKGERVAPGVTTPETYDWLTGQPVIGGLLDPRLGNEKDVEDPGYFGHIELARPVFHIGFMNTIVAVLRCVGYHSHRLLIDVTS